MGIGASDNSCAATPLIAVALKRLFHYIAITSGEEMTLVIVPAMRGGHARFV